MTGVVLVLVLGVGVASVGIAAVPDPHYDYDYEAAPVAPHELPETYADIAIEGRVVGARFLFFKEQLEAALGPLVDADAVSLRPGTEADVLVLRYLRDHVAVEADAVALTPSLLGSGEEEMGHHAGWWITVQYRADTTINEVRLRNTLLFELHEDQRNRMKVAWFPDGVPATYTAMDGQEEVIVSR